MNHDVNRQWRLARRPMGLATDADFEWREVPVPVPGPYQALVQNHFLALDSTGRCWMREEDTYLPSQRIGDVVRAVGVGVVVRSNQPGLQPGATIMGMLGWQDFSVINGSGEFFMCFPDEEQVSATMQLALLGPVGVAAYFGLTDVARPRLGEVLVVSAAASSVGCLVGQIGKLHGCHVVGITGSDEKCRWLTRELGFDAAINYKSEPVFKRLRQHCPDGIDIFFDSVGGSILEDALNLLKHRARVVVCGMVTAYNDRGGTLTLPSGPNNLVNLLFKRARLEGFVCLDYWNRAGEAIDAIIGWHRQGKIKYRAEVVHGLRDAPRMMNKLFDGSNRGKLVLEV